jgi:lactobin A/cerein 7B family class IIb bacteriocin
MKKIVALVLVLSLMAAMVFAEPVVLASEIIQTTDLISEADSMEPLFADVEAPQLAAVEAEQVEGGFWPVVVAVVVAAAVVGAAAYAGYKGYSINFFSAGR